MQWCSTIMLTLTLVRITCSRQHPRLWKREKLCGCMTSNRSSISIFPCACHVLQENAGEAVVTTVWVFTGSPCPCSPLVHTWGHQTLCHTALMSTTGFPLSVEEQMSLQFGSEHVDVGRAAGVRGWGSVGWAWSLPGGQFNVKCKCRAADGILGFQTYEFKLLLSWVWIIFHRGKAEAAWIGPWVCLCSEENRLLILWLTAFCTEKTPSSHKVPGAGCLGCDRFFLSYCFVYLIAAMLHFMHHWSFNW